MIRKLHHNAYRCSNSEATRRFYEDFLGLPLVEALEIAAARSALPGLVIADVVMPRMNGNQLYAEIQQRWPETPMLFISGYTYSDSVSRGLIGEGREFLQKPIEPDQLARTVRRLLQAGKRAP